jgi:hypothetical protein
VYRLETEQLLPVSTREAFEFFADALNLEVLTPPWLHFTVMTPRPIAMGPGTLIEYRPNARMVCGRHGRGHGAHQNRRRRTRHLCDLRPHRPATAHL